MTTQTLGKLRQDGTRHAVRLERHYDATPDEIWAILVEPQHVQNWLAQMEIEPHVGGRITFDWNGDNQDEGVVRAFEPPRLFEYTWTRNGESVIRFELRLIAWQGRLPGPWMAAKTLRLSRCQRRKEPDRIDVGAARSTDRKPGFLAGLPRPFTRSARGGALQCQATRIPKP